MIDELKDSGNVAPIIGEVPNGSETIGESTMSLFTMTPVVLEPGLIVLEKFKIIDLLGQGGMGSVYRVEHLLMERQFALKCLNKFQSADGAWRRFQNEAKAAHLLDHANLLKVYEFGLLPGGQPFFLMELVEGVTLADEIKRLGQLPVDRAVRLFIQVAFAISYAHESHVVHRDIKPSNIMVSRKSDDVETVKVVDFGIAKLTGVDEFNQQTLTKTGEIFGSPLYMSPEQCTGVAVDHRSDLYSMGCVFYETLTGAPPFMGESALSTMMKHQGDKPLSLKEASLGTTYPYVLEEIIGKLLEKDPNNRYQSAKAVAKDLIQLERRLNEESKSTLPSVEQTQSLKRMTPSLVGKELVLSVQTVSMLCALAAVVFALGAYTSYLVIVSQNQHAAVKVTADFDDPKNPRAPNYGMLFDEPSITKASEDPYDSMKPSQKEVEKVAGNIDNTKGESSEDQSEGPKGSKGLDAKSKAIQNLQKIVAQDPNYDVTVRNSKYWSKPNGSRRDYAFPRLDSLGLLLTAGGDTTDASGKCSVPRDERVGLVVSDYLVQHPSLLSKFAPNELTLLDLNKSKEAGPPFFRQIGALSQLKFLNLYDTHFQPADYPMLSNLKELRYLNLAWTAARCSQLLRFIQPQNLYSLDVSGAEDGGELIRNIHKFPKLEQLVMFSCNLQNKDLVNLRRSKLRSLCLMWNQGLSERAMDHLCEIKTMERLDVSGLTLSPQCWRQLVRMPHLQKVKMGSILWSTAEKLYFADQMRTHAPQVVTDFGSADYHDFTAAVTDIPWINEGADIHKLPTWVWLMRKRDKVAH